MVMDMTRAKTEASPRMARTRGALLAAGLELLCERPIDAIAIDEIVETAGVAKGTFFNHFEDKHDFAARIAGDIRLDLEARVGEANEGESDPAQRMARGMRVAVEFALTDRRRAQVMLRTLGDALGADHPLNKGVLRDVRDALAAGEARPQAAEAGVLFWLGLCHALMVDVAHRQLSTSVSASALQAMIVLGLTGIGVGNRQAEAIAEGEARHLLGRIDATEHGG